MIDIDLLTNEYKPVYELHSKHCEVNERVFQFGVSGLEVKCKCGVSLVDISWEVINEHLRTK